MEAIAGKFEGREVPKIRDAATPARNLTAAQKRIFNKRMDLIAPMLNPPEGVSLNEQAQSIARARGCVPRTVWTYYLRYRGGGADALVKEPRADRGRSHTVEARPLLRKFVTAKWREAGNLALIRDAVRREWGGPLLPYEGKPPSYNSLRRFLESIPAPLRDRGTNQEKDSKYAPYLVTGRGQWTRPNECWVGDHRILDVLVLNDCLPGAPRGAAVRPWLTCLQDMRTRVIVGWAWSASPSSRSIAAALRQGVERFGLPETFLMDNGKDFRKVGGEGGLLERLGVRARYCIRRHPQSKQVESFFNLLARRFDSCFPDYTGARAGARPDACREGEKKHHEYLAGKRGATPLMPASHFMALCGQWLDEYNRTHEHGGLGMDGRAPLDVMDELLPLAQRRIPAMAELAPLFWDEQRRKVRNGKVELDGATYSAPLDDEQAQQNMYLANARTVVVRRDPQDASRALAFEDGPSGALLARLESDELRAQGPIPEDELRAHLRLRARLDRAAKKAADAMAYGVPREIDLLADRAGLERAPAPKRPPRRIASSAQQFAEEFIEQFRKAE